MAKAPLGTFAEVAPLIVLEPETETVTSPEALGTKISVKKLLPKGVGRLMVVFPEFVTYSSEALSLAPRVTGEEACVTIGTPILQLTKCRELLTHTIRAATILVNSTIAGLAPSPTVEIP